MRVLDHLRIPYLQRVGVGLHLGRSAIHWIELERVVGRVRLRRYEVEPVVGNEREAALHRLAERVERGLPVVSHLDMHAVRIELVEGPTFEDEEDLDVWLEGHARRVKPDFGEGFSVRTAILEHSADRTLCCVAVARTQAVEDRVAVLRSAGLVVERLATGSMEAGAAFLLGEAAQAERTLVLAESDDVSVLRLYDGRLVHLGALGALSPASLLDEVQTHVQMWERPPEAVQVTGAVARSVLNADRGKSRGYEVGLVKPTIRGARVGPEATLAVALAAEALFPGLAMIDFLASEDHDQARAVWDKREGQRAILLMGSVLLGILLFLSLGSRWLAAEAERTDEAVLENMEVLVQLDRARAASERLRADLKSGRVLVATRTRTALWVEDVGRALPEGAWLTHLRLASAEGGSVASVSGYGLDDDQVNAYVSALEQLEIVDAIRLLYTERLGPPEVELLSDARTRTPLVRFALEVHLALEPRPGGRGR